MIVAVCVDDKNGMMFNKRRQSQDRIQRQHLRKLAEGRMIWMNSYSAVLFLKDSEQLTAGLESGAQEAFAQPNICVDEDFLDRAGENEICFVENQSVLEYTEKIEGVILYKWNRVYPSDRFFDLDLSGEEWKLTESEEFEGSSHEKITMEFYRSHSQVSQSNGEAKE